MGINRTQLIDTEKDQYSQTRLWALAIHTQCPAAQGLKWVSRQDDSASAFMFFGDRIPKGAFKHMEPSNNLLEDTETRDVVSALAEHIGVTLIPG